uniref:cytochrome c oxidase subunit III n=1 Tax=Melecta chinensis TaxID=582934 RepID=UPI002551DD6C|nr:cytochrome c oxidase subunit III [Melecta chinensis]WFP44655.1 cytochrome c oxidase subunit 3 [Melecta chinensis]
MNNYNHPYHLVTNSPWPLFLSISIFNILMNICMWFNLEEFKIKILMINFLIFFLCFNLWIRDVIRESFFQGMHTLMISKFLKFSMILFILSELFFFISFFWTYFHMFIAPDPEIGMQWPPKNIIMFDPYEVPLMNSIILIASGISVTWCHNSLLNNNYNDSKTSLSLTISLGVCFSLFQYIEYKDSFFCINDSIFGSIFFLMTGFHGLHIIIGIIMLSYSLGRFINQQMSKTHHFNFELSLWYWHFVDVIWLFLYLFLYWWV